MDPANWRKKAELSLREVAALVGCGSPMSVQRYETGEREAPNSVALAYERISKGEVTGADLERARRAHQRRGKRARSAA